VTPAVPLPTKFKSSCGTQSTTKDALKIGEFLRNSRNSSCYGYENRSNRKCRTDSPATFTGDRSLFRLAGSSERRTWNRKGAQCITGELPLGYLLFGCPCLLLPSCGPRRALPTLFSYLQTTLGMAMLDRLMTPVPSRLHSSIEWPMRELVSPASMFRRHIVLRHEELS
jgi:hypothetical protein